MIEAAGRIGGRAHTVGLAPGIAFDRGCAGPVGGEANPFAAMADAPGIPIDRDHAHLFRLDHHRFHRNGAPLEAAEQAACRAFMHDCHAAIAAAAAAGCDMALSAAIDSANPSRPRSAPP